MKFKKLFDAALTAALLTLVFASCEKANAHASADADDEVIVAVIDTGADLNHEALRDMLWTNAGETGRDAKGGDKESNGIDDDGNGFIDDVHGWNFAGQNNIVQDNHGHGTHIAGIIAQSAKSEAGPAAKPIKLMILKYFATGLAQDETLTATVAAIRYAVKMKARIINYSAGGRLPNDAERIAIANAGRNNVLFVSAAGNDSADVDSRGYYPAAYALPNILSVTATDRDKRVLASSNYGATTITLAAPGKDIVSSIPRGRYGRMTGTSQATAFASGAAALVMATGAGLDDPGLLISILSATAIQSPTLIGKTRSGGQLDSFRAVAMKDTGTSATGEFLVNTNDATVARFTVEP